MLLPHLECFGLHRREGANPDRPSGTAADQFASFAVIRNFRK